MDQAQEGRSVWPAKEHGPDQVRSAEEALRTKSDTVVCRGACYRVTVRRTGPPRHVDPAGHRRRTDRWTGPAGRPKCYKIYDPPSGPVRSGTPEQSAGNRPRVVPDHRFEKRTGLAKWCGVDQVRPVFKNGSGGPDRSIFTALLLRAYGVPEPHTMKLFLLAPRFDFVDAIEKMGFEPTSKCFTLAVRSMAAISKLNWENVDSTYSVAAGIFPKVGEAVGFATHHDPPDDVVGVGGVVDGGVMVGGVVVGGVTVGGVVVGGVTVGGVVVGGVRVGGVMVGDGGDITGFTIGVTVGGVVVGGVTVGGVVVGGVRVGGVMVGDGGDITGFTIGVTVGGVVVGGVTVGGVVVGGVRVGGVMVGDGGDITGFTIGVVVPGGVGFTMGTAVSSWVVYSEGDEGIHFS
ncbi:hypothetical protein LWI29_036972 [Acer saccharum]|uniref:Uncharacterized protein n=1 Tax=Acer saccharum TaxID=4024 RepID=A0AA39RZJ6_ACESA|nr:hypothetical protein LWI29_036972 [Acer saccharum]